MIKAIKFGDPICWDSKGGTVEPWENCFNGTFSNSEPLSIMINRGVVIRDNSCHSLWGYPESVAWIKKDGSHGLSRVQTYTQIPGWKDIVFAIGGLGISNLNAELEGFCTFKAMNPNTKKEETKHFGDVTDYTEHSVFGFKDGKFFGSIMKGTPEQIKTECERQGFDSVVMGDGRSWASCNTQEFTLNMDHTQHSLVQIENVVEVNLVDKPVETVDKPVKKKWLWFKRQEFANTKDGNANETKDELIDKCDLFRSIIMMSMTVLSGFRTWLFNKLVKGSSNSYHLTGEAADLRFNFKGWTWISLAAVARYVGFTNIGFYWTLGRIGWKLNRIHVDIGKPRNGKEFCIMHWSASGKFIKKT